MSQIDSIDCRLLEQLQRDATISLDALAEESGISLNTVWRRIKRLEANGILEGRVAMVDNEKVGLPLTVFVRIRTDDHSAAWAKALTTAVANIPEIVEFYRLAGDVDYILKLIVASVADYDRVYQALIAKVSINDVAASFAMEKLKFTTELPIKPMG
ncbi:MAG: Lrp/AsnC family transcriptional regulator [Pseudomonadota bacterium]